MPALASAPVLPARSDIDFRDLGYCAIYTGESWEQLLAAVSGLVVLTRADRSALRDGWDEAQLDLAAFHCDMTELAATGHGEFPW